MKKGKGQRKLGLSIAICFIGTLLVAPPSTATTATPMKFGMDASAVSSLTSWGLKPNYATMWVGVWTQKSGWSGVDATLDRLYAQGITPVIQFYYWGNDISRSCLEYGCWSNLHQAQKNKAGWQQLAQGLASHLKAHMKGRAAVIVIETEFNKGDVATYEPLDGYLAAKANYFRTSYPPSQPVLGFGNWGASSWGTFDRAAAASTFVGIQGMRASTRDSVDSYRGLVTGLYAGSKTLQQKFHKAILITDLALSSYWEPDWLSHQKAVIATFFVRLAEFKAVGVVGMIYRGLYDNPTATTKEYYGEAERHFGLAWAYTKKWKPAMTAWANGVKAERAHPAALPSTITTQVESFRYRNFGFLAIDQAAYGDRLWNLDVNGYVAHPFQLDPGTYQVRVRARGDAMDGVSPRMLIILDGVRLAAASVAPGDFRDYTGTATVAASGAHVLKLEFTNDARSATDDRNLLLDRVQVVRIR